MSRHVITHDVVMIYDAIFAGPHFQDWKCKENEPGIEGWPQQDGLPHIGDLLYRQ